MNQPFSGVRDGRGRGRLTIVLGSLLAMAVAGFCITWMRERTRQQDLRSEAEYQAYKKRTADHNAAVEATNKALMTNEQRAYVERLQDVVEVHAFELFDDCARNEVAANKRYKGKILTVSGTIGEIRTDITNAPYVAFRQVNAVFSIQAIFDRDSTGGLVNLVSGMDIRVKCQCDGKVINVLLTGCTLMRGPDLLEHDVVR